MSSIVTETAVVIRADIVISAPSSFVFSFVRRLPRWPEFIPYIGSMTGPEVASEGNVYVETVASDGKKHNTTVLIVRPDSHLEFYSDEVGSGIRVTLAQVNQCISMGLLHLFLIQLNYFIS